MSVACSIKPPKGPNQKPELFDEIKFKVSRQLGKDPKSKKLAYDTTWKLYGLATSSKFRDDYNESLKFSSDGFPTFESLMENEQARKVLGSELQNKLYESNFKERDNTRDDYKLALESTLAFNKAHISKIATVETNDKGKLVIKVRDRNGSTLQEFREQYAAFQVSQEIAKLLEPLGITIGDIIGDEAGIRNGKVDFTRAKDILDGTNSLIMVANNMAGAKAIGEEMAHLIVGTRRTQPLVQRLLNALSSNEEALRKILGDKYDAEVAAQNGDMSKVAEEALGQLLHRHLIDNKLEESMKKNDGFFDTVRKIFDRLRNFIFGKFKGKSLNTTAEILNEAENAMSDLAKNVADGTVKLTKRDIKRSYSNTVLNDLNDQIARNIKVLEAAIKTEQKRLNITEGSANRNSITTILNELERGTQPSADSLLTVYKYLEYAGKELARQEASLRDFNTLEYKKKFKTLRRTRSYLQSFAPIVNMLYEVSGENREDTDPDIFAKGFSYEGNVVNINDILKNLNSNISQLTGQFKRLVVPTFAEFIKPIVGEIKNTDGTILDIKEMLTMQVGDISIMDRWLDSMADSNDQLLQTLDSILRTQKDKARLKSLKDIRKIQALQKKAAEKGITSFAWMFETYRDGGKTGNYISDINYAQYYKDLKEFNDYLDRKYGKNVRDREIREKKRAEKQEWLDKHSILDIFGNFIPSPSIYHNTEYDKLSADQKEILSDYLALKAEFDKNYPSDKVGNGAIQLRRDRLQRYIDIAKSPSTIFDTIKSAWESNFINQSDDDQMYGQRTKKALMDFDGKQFNILPILYQNKLSDPNELSTDVFCAMTAYAISSNDYAAVSDVIDALEIGRTLVTDNIRKTQETVGGNPMVESLTVGREKIKHQILKGKTQAEDKVNEWFDSQVYGKHYAEEIEVSIPILNKKVSTVKLTSAMTRMASTCQLAFNWLANMANVGTGLAMMNIEVASGEFFNAKELASADKEYASLMPSFMKEFNSRYPTNKLALFDELFNVKYQFDNRGRLSQRPSWMARIFGKEIGFIGQDGGDHWLYNRVAIAMAKREKVKVPDGNGSYKTMSLWDALEIKDSPEGAGLKQMELPEGILDSKGNEFNVGKFSRKIGKVSQRLFGIYNEEDRNMAQRHSLGRLMLLYRQWMKPQFNTRFQAKQYNQTLEAFEEGHYRTVMRLASDLSLGKIKLAGFWDNLEDFEKRNIIRSFVEIIQCFAVYALANFVAWPDDKDSPWLMRMAEYMAQREKHELGNLTPSLIMIDELTATLKSPSAALGVVESTTRWVHSMLTPSDWNTELQSGPWKGHTKLYKNTMKLPIPVINWYHQIDKFTGDLEDQINYYARTTQK